MNQAALEEETMLIRLARRIWRLTRAGLTFRTIAFAGFLPALCVAMNIVLYKTKGWGSKNPDAGVLLILSMAHTLMVAVIGSWKSRGTSGVERIKIGSIMGTVGYLHTLVGMLATFGTASDAPAEADEKQQAARDVFYGIATSLATSVVGWATGKWVETGGGEHNAASPIDDLRIDIEKLKVMQQHTETSVGKILKGVRKHSAHTEEINKKFLDGSSAVLTSVEEFLAAAKGAQTQLSDQFARLSVVISQLTPAMSGWRDASMALADQAAEMLRVQEQMIEIQRGMSKSTVEQGNALEGSTRAAVQTFRDMEAALGRIRDHLLTIDGMAARAVEESRSSAGDGAMKLAATEP